LEEEEGEMKNLSKWKRNKEYIWGQGGIKKKKVEY